MVKPPDPVCILKVPSPLPRYTPMTSCIHKNMSRSMEKPLNNRLQSDDSHFPQSSKNPPSFHPHFSRFFIGGAGGRHIDALSDCPHKQCRFFTSFLRKASLKDGSWCKLILLFKARGSKRKVLHARKEDVFWL